MAMMLMMLHHDGPTKRNKFQFYMLVKHGQTKNLRSRSSPQAYLTPYLGIFSWSAYKRNARGSESGMSFDPRLGDVGGLGIPPE